MDRDILCISTSYLVLLNYLMMVILIRFRGKNYFTTSVLVFVFYLIPGLGSSSKDNKWIPTTRSYSESPSGLNTSTISIEETENTHIGPQGIAVFHDIDEGLAYAKKNNKPTFLDFTGHACVNCRKMEEKVWGEEGVLDILR